MDSIPQKCCSKCGTTFPATTEYFHSSKEKKDGLHGWCKACRFTYNKGTPEKKRATQRKYDAAHIAEKRQYRKTHIDAINANYRKYVQSHRDEVNARSRNRRAYTRSNGGTHTAQDIRKQYANQKGKCYYCKIKVGKAFHVDHVIPLMHGGSNGPENLVIACPSCNLSKQDKMPYEWPQGRLL